MESARLYIISPFYFLLYPSSASADVVVVPAGHANVASTISTGHADVASTFSDVKLELGDPLPSKISLSFTLSLLGLEPQRLLRSTIPIDPVLPVISPCTCKLQATGFWVRSSRETGQVGSCRDELAYEPTSLKCGWVGTCTERGPRGPSLF